ncbi:acetyl-CoA carboxylase biotin carboxyl carrier protein [Luteithermobacter gelatinilyticus]|uniref:acetyl-CoA carboxylase biotin carboxyl carrier protein n=1 Tax=Luteithermobacter gelatinilyticus TaxID=2582913 RepID=UPI001AEFE359|nr:acetyl-CoA carboxylase biotin carboxyl carrier protein [Luteithermobacter gelatinilyticus]
MSKMHVDQELIRDLAALLNETDLTEIEVEDGERKIRVARTATAVAAAAPVAPAPVAAAPAAPTAESSAGSDLSSHPGAVTSPMVGTVYVAPEPGADPYIKVGDRVNSGDTLLIVEAMKVMNHIHAPKSGTVTQILVENGQPVEYGEPLVIIE